MGRGDEGDSEPEKTVDGADVQDQVLVHIKTDEDFYASLPETELNWYSRNRVSCDELETKKIQCTVCLKQVNHKKSDSITRHPLLGVVVCKSCAEFYYQDGEWTRDDEGSFEYCGWCANGGDLVCCASES